MLPPTAPRRHQRGRGARLVAALTVTAQLRAEKSARAMPKAKPASAGSGAASAKPKSVKKVAKPKMCGGAPPYALKGHCPADKGCIEGCCKFCCVKRAMWEHCDVHRDDDEDSER